MIVLQNLEIEVDASSPSPFERSQVFEEFDYAVVQSSLPWKNCHYSFHQTKNWQVGEEWHSSSLQN